MYVLYVCEKESVYVLYTVCVRERVYVCERYTHTINSASPIQR